MIPTRSRHGLALLLVLTGCSDDETTLAQDAPAGDDGATLAQDAPSSDGAPEPEAPPADLNLLQNPSLETWTDAATPNTTPDLWTNCSESGDAVDAVPDSCSDGGTAADGTRYARAYWDEGLAQVIPTTVGATYLVAFQRKGVSGCFGGGPNASWVVLVDGTAIFSTAEDADESWRPATTTFVATTSMTTLCFRHACGGQGGIDKLDVSLQTTR